MKINNFSNNRPILHDIKADINRALFEVEEKYGIKLNVGNISYREFEFTTKITATINSGDAVKKSEETELSKWKLGVMYHPDELKEEMFGKTFEANGKTLKIIGYNFKAKKNPIVLEDSKGKKYKASVSMIRMVA